MHPIQKIPKALITLTLIAFATLLVWVIIQGQSNSSRLPTATPSFQPPSTPTTIPAKGFVVNIPQKALWKNYVTVSIEAPPGTKCELVYVPPAGQTHQTTTTADTSGLCVWNWKIEETEGKGNGRLIFIIGHKSETHFIEIRSAF
jgi:hypothetical protein